MREFGSFLAVRGPYLEWWNTHANHSFTLGGSSSNTDTYVAPSEFVELIRDALKLGIHKRLVVPAPVRKLHSAPPPTPALPAVGHKAAEDADTEDADTPLTKSEPSEDAAPYRARLKPPSASLSPTGQTAVVNVLVPHFNRTGFLRDMLRNLTLTGDAEFVVRLVDFNTHDLRSKKQVERLFRGWCLSLCVVLLW